MKKIEKSKPFSVISVLALGIVLAASPVQADLVVNQDLGNLGTGAFPLVGSTVDGANNADGYAGITNPAANWAQEVVFQFTTSAAFSMSIASVSLTGDPDAFLLNSLTTAPAGAKFEAQGALASGFLDNAPPETNVFGTFPAGTYYVSVDSFIGVDGAIVPGDATFSFQLILATPGQAPNATPLGPIAAQFVPFTLDTLGSNFDTELAVWDSTGTLIAANDDEPGGALQSRIDFPGGLAPGLYYVGLGGWDTVWATGFAASGGGDAGDFNLNHPLGVAQGALAANTFVYYSFEITGGNGEPPNAAHLGPIVAESVAFSLDTVGSSFDTELAVWDATGVLVATNDDIAGGGGSLQSRLDFVSGLAQGLYYVAIGGFDSVFGNGFAAGGGGAFGDYVFNYPGGTLGIPLAGGLAYYSFDVTGVDAPFAITDITVSAPAAGMRTVVVTALSTPNAPGTLRRSSGLGTWSDVQTANANGAGVLSFTLMEPDATTELYLRVER